MSTAYVYNALGERIAKLDPSGSTLFMYDEVGHLLGEYDGNGNLLEETLWMGDIPVATLRPNGSGGVSVYYIHADHLNSPRAITRPSDNEIVWRWDRDPFGATQPQQNPGGLGTFVYNLRLPGQYFDPETGLSYDYMRDFDAGTGRYVESDPGSQGRCEHIRLCQEKSEQPRGPAGAMVVHVWGLPGCRSGVHVWKRRRAFLWYWQSGTGFGWRLVLGSTW